MSTSDLTVDELIAALLDEQSPDDWTQAASALRAIGRPAFAPLAETIALAPTDETRRRCSWAFNGFGPEVIDLYAQTLSHPDWRVREQAAIGVQFCGEAGLPALPSLLPLLADPNEEVRQRAIWAIAKVGEGSLPQLQQIRTTGPGHLRAGALEAIAEVGGEAAFSDADRAAVRRLIRIKARDETPEALQGCGLCGLWLALPTTDQAAVIDALGLSDPRPVTMRLGFAAFYCDGHGMAPGKQRKGRVFVTPAFDGWTLVMGAWYAHWGGLKKETKACRELSELFGKAQAYWYDQQTGSGSWIICEKGELIRSYNQDEPKDAVGDRLPVEEGLLLSFEELTDEEFENLGDDYEMCDALTVADAMSVSPGGLGPHTRVTGNGMLALTRHGRKHGVPRGALPI